VANDQTLSLFDKVDVDWTRSRTIGAIYRTLFRLRAEHKAMSRGEMIRIPTTDEDRTYAFFRSAGNDRVLTVLRFSADTGTVSVRIPMGKLYPGKSFIGLTDVFSGRQTVVNRDTDGELKLDLDPYGYRVYVVE
jgi:hypothetical protein